MGRLTLRNTTSLPRVLRHYSSITTFSMTIFNTSFQHEILHTTGRLERMERRNDDNLELAIDRWSLMEFFFLRC